MKISVISIIKIVTFNVNPRFTEVTLRSFIFVRDISRTNPARIFGIIYIKNEVNFCLLHFDFVNEI